MQTNGSEGLGTFLKVGGPSLHSKGPLGLPDTEGRMDGLTYRAVLF